MIVCSQAVTGGVGHVITGAIADIGSFFANRLYCSQSYLTNRGGNLFGN